MDHTTQRRGTSLRLGVRIGLTLAVLMVIFAAYNLWLPVDITGRNGLQFDCGSVVDPPTDTFRKGYCGSVVDRERVVVIFTLIAALFVAAGSLFCFGFDRRPRPPEVTSHDTERF